MKQAVLDVLRALLDAAFKAGSLTDQQHTDLNGQLDAAAAEPAPAPAPEPEPAPAPPLEPSPVVDVETGGTEAGGFGG